MGLLAIAAGSYLAARVLGTWELYLASFAFLATVIACWLLMLPAGRGLSATRAVSPGAPVAGDDLAVVIRVASRSWLPGCQITLLDATGALGAGRQKVEVASLGPRAEVVVRAAPLTARRGVFHLPALWADTEDPLGLVCARRRLGEPLDVTVYPRLVHLRSCVLAPESGLRRDRGRRGEVRLGTEEFRGIRPHAPGEPLSRVDWKATAKTGTVMLREMDDPLSGDLTVALEAPAGHDAAAAQASDGVPAGFELAVQVAGSVAAFALRAGRGVNVILPGAGWQQARLTPDVNGHLRLLDGLARATPGGTSRLPTSLLGSHTGGGRVERAQALTLVTLGLDRELAQALLAARQRGTRVSVVHVEAQAGAAAARSGPAGSAAPGAAPTDLLIALAAAGVPCVAVRPGDDLSTALSLPTAAASWSGR